MNKTIKNKIDELFDLLYTNTIDYKLQSINEFINNVDKLYVILQYIHRNKNHVSLNSTFDDNKYSIKIF